MGQLVDVFEDALAHGRSVDGVARHAHVRDGRATGGPSEGPPLSGPGIPAPAAIEGQLGLKCERREKLMDVILIDHIARPLTSRCMGSSLVLTVWGK